MGIHKVIKQWKHKGMDCLVLGISMKYPYEFNHYCGYVRAKRCRWDLMDGELVYVDVHGGITWQGPFDNINIGGFWYGFDCAHYDDYLPMYSEYKLLERNLHSWTEDEVVAETEHLSVQIKRLDNPIVRLLILIKYVFLNLWSQ